MELLTAEERRTRKIYRWVFIGAIVVIVAIAIWVARPPQAVNLRFLGSLKPTMTSGDPIDSYRTLTFKQPPAVVEKLLDQHLNRETHWRKNPGFGGPGQISYEAQGRSSVTISLMPQGPTGSVMMINDPRRVVLLP